MAQFATFLAAISILMATAGVSARNSSKRQREGKLCKYKQLSWLDEKIMIILFFPSLLHPQYLCFKLSPFLMTSVLEQIQRMERATQVSSLGIAT